MALLLPKSVFVHTPKTAGQWVADALLRAATVDGEIGSVHSPPDELAASSEWLQRPNRFTFVRHPLSWYASMWAHRMDEAWTPIDDPAWFSAEWIGRWAEFTARTRADEFAPFVTRCLDAFPNGWVSSLFSEYTNGCTVVGKQEDLPGGLAPLLAGFGEAFDPQRLADTPVKNTRGSTPKRRRQTIVTTKLVDRVYEVESLAIECFGYESLPSWVSEQLH